MTANEAGCALIQAYYAAFNLPAAAGQRYVLPGAATFQIRDGTITRVSNHYNLADWLVQVGA